ncbi:MAG: helicase, type site-specific restriction-modification system restriction subunit [Chloroflexi bacterium]|nr:helicase, type site-specific restriction-modification system restriction subunit [Chloroflexota bacterium]
MDKKQLSERDICTKFITPALRQAGWDELTQLREEVSFTKGRIIVRGQMVKRGKAKRADYILYYKPNIPLAVIEAKDNHCSMGDGLQQALEYAQTLQLPFVFSSNGDGFVFHDGTARSGAIDERRWLCLPRWHRQERRDRTKPAARRVPVARSVVGPVSRVERVAARS